MAPSEAEALGEAPPEAVPAPVAEACRVAREEALGRVSEGEGGAVAGVEGEALGVGASVAGAEAVSAALGVGAAEREGLKEGEVEGVAGALALVLGVGGALPVAPCAASEGEAEGEAGGEGEALSLPAPPLETVGAALTLPAALALPEVAPVALGRAGEGVVEGEGTLGVAVPTPAPALEAVAGGEAVAGPVAGALALAAAEAVARAPGLPVAAPGAREGVSRLLGEASRGVAVSVDREESVGWEEEEGGLFEGEEEREAGMEAAGEGESWGEGEGLTMAVAVALGEDVGGGVRVAGAEGEAGAEAAALVEAAVVELGEALAPALALLAPLGVTLIEEVAEAGAGVALPPPPPPLPLLGDAAALALRCAVPETRGVADCVALVSTLGVGGAEAADERVRAGEGVLCGVLDTEAEGAGDSVPAAPASVGVGK